MNIVKRIWKALNPEFLGGELASMVGEVRGQHALGTNPDLFKATGEIRVHAIQNRKGDPMVTVELLQAQVPGDASNMLCIRLPVVEAARLATMLHDAGAAATGLTAS